MKESFHQATQNKVRFYGAGWKEYLKYDNTRTHTNYFSLHIIHRRQNSVFDNTYVDVIYLKVRIKKGKVNSIHHYKVQNDSFKTAHQQATIVFHDDRKTSLSSGIQTAFCATRKHYGPLSYILQPHFFYNETGKYNCVFWVPLQPYA